MLSGQRRLILDQAYGRAKSRFGFVSSFYGQLTNVATIHFDLLPKLWGLTGLWMSRYAPAGFRGEITHSIVFFVAFNLAGNLANMPLQYYKNFVLEEEFGFNKQTKKLVCVIRCLDMAERLLTVKVVFHGCHQDSALDRCSRFPGSRWFLEDR